LSGFDELEDGQAPMGRMTPDLMEAGRKRKMCRPGRKSFAHFVPADLQNPDAGWLLFSSSPLRKG
jgi:hypothetical protein